MFITDYYKKRSTENLKNIFDAKGIDTLNLKGGVGYRYEKLPLNASRFCGRMTSFCQKIANAEFTYNSTSGKYKLQYTNVGMKDLRERHSVWQSEMFHDTLMGCTPPWQVTSVKPLTLARCILEDNERKFRCEPSYVKHYITFAEEFDVNNCCNEAFDMVPGDEKCLDCTSDCVKCISTWPYVKCQFHEECDMTQLNDLHKCYECEKVTCQDHRVSWGSGDEGTMLCCQCYQHFLNGREGKNLRVAQICWLGKPDHKGIYAEHIKDLDSDSE